MWKRCQGEVALTFDDIAVHFSEEEWDYLEEWQKDLHKNVMWENYEALTSLGFHVARPVVPLKSDQQVEIQTGASAATGVAQIPNKRYSAGTRLPNRRTSSDVAKTAAECHEIAEECQESAFPRNPKIASGDVGYSIGTSIARNRSLRNPAFAHRSSGYTLQTNQGARNTCTSTPGAVYVESAENTAEFSRAASVAPNNTRDLRARAGSSLRFCRKGQLADGPVQERRTGSDFVEDTEAPRSTFEEDVLQRNTGMRFSPRNSEESTSESSSTEESLRPSNSVSNKWTSNMSRDRLRKRHSRTPRTMRLLLFQQRKIMRELRDLRRSNELLQCSIVKVMEDMRRKPENPITRLIEEGTLPFREINPVEDRGLRDSELCFINSPPLNTSCQPVAQTVGSQGAVNNVVCDISPFAEPDKHHKIVPFSSQDHTSPHIASTPSSYASPLRQSGSVPIDSMAEAMHHNTHSCTSLTEALSGDLPCVPIPTLKQEPGTVTVESMRQTAVLPFPRSARREKRGESLPDIPLAYLTPERQAVLIRHSRGEPQTLGKFLFQHYVPFHVYESWVHTTNFDGSRNKRAIPRNLRTEIMRFIAARFRLVQEDKKQIRDRINELLRMPRTGGWPVLN